MNGNYLLKNGGNSGYEGLRMIFEMKQLVKQYKCFFCTKTYYSIAGLKTHMKEKHGGEWIPSGRY